MTKFAFVVHPIEAKDVARYYPIAKLFPGPLIEAAIKFKSPKILSEITGIESKTGAKTEGIFVGLPLTPRQMVDTMPLEEVYNRIVRCAEIAEEYGAKLIGLGAFSSVVGDGGLTIAKRANIAVTTGNSYTVATAIQGTLKACDLVGVIPAESTLAIVGATGSIGKTCARMLASKFHDSILIGRDLARTLEIAHEVGVAKATIDIEDIRFADVVITVTSSDAPVIMPRHLKPGAIVCDVSRPRDVSVKVSRERKDVLVIEGGVVRVPGNVEFNFDFGFPASTAYACMSETMLLALEDRAENFTLGKDVSVAQAEEMIRLADKHGFELAGFRSFEKEVDQAAIDRAIAARKKAGKNTGIENAFAHR